MTRTETLPFKNELGAGRMRTMLSEVGLSKGRETRVVKSQVRSLFFVGLLIAAAAASASADTITLGQSTQTCTSSNTSGCIVISGEAGGPFTVTFPATLSGATIPGGGYSFSGVVTLTFTGGSGASGSPFSSAGMAGTLTLPDGVVEPITWTLLDGDGAGYVLQFVTPLGGVDDIFLSAPVNSGAPANFTALFTDGGTADLYVSSGEVVVSVPEPAALALFGSGLLGLGALRLVGFAEVIGSKMRS